MIIAVDTGGTKTLVACFDRNGHKKHMTKFPTPTDFTSYTKRICTEITAMAESLRDIDAIVVALPGTLEDGRIVRMSNLPWQSVDIVSALHNELQTTSVPIFIENDAHLGALGETRPLESPPKRCLYLTISTGINGGLVIDGTLDDSLVAAELGHIMLHHDNAMMRWEDFASGKAIKQTYKKLASEINDTGTWRTIATNIAQGMVVILPVLRPDLVIIGGGVGAHYSQFGHYLEQFIEDILPEHYRATVIQAKHPEEAVVYGCYYYGVDALNH